MVMLERRQEVDRLLARLAGDPTGAEPAQAGWGAAVRSAAGGQAGGGEAAGGRAAGGG
jgi:hypothetical protein